MVTNSLAPPSSAVGTDDIQLSVTGDNDFVQIPVAQQVSAIPLNQAIPISGDVAATTTTPTGLIHAVIIQTGQGLSQRGGIMVMFCQEKAYQLTPPGRLSNAARACQYFDLVADEQIVEIRFRQNTRTLDAIQFITSHG